MELPGTTDLEQLRELPPPLPARKRLDDLDITRGLLILLMTSTHALTLAEVPDGSFWRSVLWLPRGWATFSFIILSGVTVAAVMPWRTDPARARRVVGRRAWQLLAILFVSNAVFQLLKLDPESAFDRATSESWWTALVTTASSYGLSGALFPIALLLPATPWLYRLVVRAGWPVVFGCAVAAALGGVWVQDWLVMHPENIRPLNELLFVQGLGGFPVVPLASCGAVGFLLGLQGMVRESELAPRRLVVGLAVLVVVTFLIELPHSRWTFVLALLETLLHFLVIFFAAQALSVRAPLASRRVLGLIGRYALFAFLAHRILLQAVHALVERAPIPPGATYLGAFAGTMATIWVLARWRLASPEADRRLKTIGL